MKVENTQTRKKPEKLDVLEGMLATLLNVKGHEGTTENTSQFPDSSNIIGETMVPWAREAATVTMEQQLSAKQIKLPSFVGEETGGWLARAEQYFSIHRTPVHMKV